MSECLEKETTFTPGPWSLCCEKCHTVTSHDHPICDVTQGDFGDSYPAVRLILDDAHGLHGQLAEAYMEKSVYGHVKKETATANATLIAAAPELYEALAEIELQWCPYSDADLERFAMMRPKDDGKVPPHWAEKILNARRVLRKARGEDRSHEGK